jgi:hypothetical protein
MITHELVFKAIAMFLQKAWGIRHAYKHGSPVDVFDVFAGVIH